MFFGEVRTKQDLYYISVCSLSILYNSKFILTATSSGTNAVVVTRDPFIWKIIKNDITKTCLFKYTENFTNKKWKFSDKNSDIFHISTQNLECGYSLEPPRRGGSNEYPQSMFLSRNKKNNVYPCKPQFYYI